MIFKFILEVSCFNIQQVQCCREQFMLKHDNYYRSHNIPLGGGYGLGSPETIILQIKYAFVSIMIAHCFHVVTFLKACVS